MAQVYSSATSPEVAQKVASYILKHQDEAIAATGSFKIAISGGSMGKVLKAGLIDNAAAAPHVKWDKWTVFFSDERLVPLDHAESNYGLFNLLVLAHLTGPKPQVVTIDESLLSGSEGQLEGADESKDNAIAEAYAKALPADLKLDLVLLGCGPDGHTCSLFPDHPMLKEQTKSIGLVRDSPKPPPRRITFTYPVLAKAGAIAFIAEGENKTPVLDDIFNNEASKLPCKYVNDLPVSVSWFVNDAALKGITVPVSKY